MPKLLSLTDIAKRLKIPFHRLRYVVAAANMQPVQRVGIVRLWSEDQMPEMKAALVKKPKKSQTAAAPTKAQEMAHIR